MQRVKGWSVLEDKTWSLWLSMQGLLGPPLPVSGELVICDTVRQEVDSNRAAALHKRQGSHQYGFTANAGDHLRDLGEQRDVELRNRRVIP